MDFFPPPHNDTMLSTAKCFSKNSLLPLDCAHRNQDYKENHKCKFPAKERTKDSNVKLFVLILAFSRNTASDASE